MTTAFPVTDAIGTLKPGVYAMIARPHEKSTRSLATSVATQWFIVSDLGLTAFTGDDGVHAFVRSLRGRDADRRRERPAHRPQQRGPRRPPRPTTTATPLRPGQTRGEGGTAPAILVAENGDGEYAFLDLHRSTPSTFLTAASRAATPRARSTATSIPNAASIAPARTCNVTALVRDQCRQAAAAAVDADRPRAPTASSTAASPWPIKASAAARCTLPLGGGAMTGTWRAQAAHRSRRPTRSRKRPSWSRTSSRNARSEAEAGEGIRCRPTKSRSTASGRYLYGPPAAGLAIEGDIVVRASPRTSKASRLRVRPGRREDQPVRKPLENLPATGEDGNADVAHPAAGGPQDRPPARGRRHPPAARTGGRTIERVVTLPVEPGEARIGIKPQFDRPTSSAKARRQFEAILLGCRGQPADDRRPSGSSTRLDPTGSGTGRDGSLDLRSPTITRKGLRAAPLERSLTRPPRSRPSSVTAATAWK